MSSTENPILRSSYDVRNVSSPPTIVENYDDEESPSIDTGGESSLQSESTNPSSLNPSESDFSSDESSDDTSSSEDEDEEVEENKAHESIHTQRSISRTPSLATTFRPTSLATVTYGKSVVQNPVPEDVSVVSTLNTPLNPTDDENHHNTNTITNNNKSMALSKKKKKRKKKRTPKPPQPRWVKTWNNFYYRPIFVFFRAFLIAWIYVLMPCDNYWIYYLVKNQYWCVLTLTSYVELFSTILPDVPESLYIACYVVGFMVAPLTRVLEYFYGMQAYSILDTVTVLFSLFIIIFFFTIDTLRYPYTKHQLRLREKMERKNSLTLPSGEPLPIENSMEVGPSGLYRSMFYAIGRPRTSSRAPEEEEEDGGMVRAGLPAPLFTPSMVFSPSIASFADPTTRQHGTPDVELPNQGEQRGPQISIDHFYERTSLAAGLKKSKKLSPPTVFRTAHNRIKLVDPRLRAVCDAIVAVLDTLFVSKYFFFLPRFWNHRYWLRHSKLHPLLNRRWLVIRTSIFIMVYCTDYLFLIYFTEYFRQNADSNYKRVGLFLIYISVNTVYRTIVKTLGMLLDKYKGRSVSMFFLGEVMGLFFYYCFYRVLFESIRSIPEFAAFQLMHLGSEWVLYVLRCTKWYYDKSEAWVLKYSPNWFLNKNRMSHKSWQQFIALDFGIRCAVFITTGYGILAMLITIQYVSWVGNVSGLLENRDSFIYTSCFIVAAVVLEFLNAWGMNRFFFHKQGLDVQSEVRHCFSLPHFALLSLLIACNLLTNPIFAFITVDYQT